MPRPQLLERLILFTLDWILPDSIILRTTHSPWDSGGFTQVPAWLHSGGTWMPSALPGPTAVRPTPLVPQTRHEGRGPKEPQGCAEAVAQRDQSFCRCCYRMGHGRGCSAAKLGAAEQAPSPRGTAEPQAPSVINISSRQLHQPFWGISSMGRTSDFSKSGALLAQMPLQ